jgi:hypothetical protein
MARLLALPLSSHRHIPRYTRPKKPIFNGMLLAGLAAFLQSPDDKRVISHFAIGAVSRRRKFRSMAKLVQLRRVTIATDIPIAHGPDRHLFAMVTNPISMPVP